ncbi:type II toxin-antitoxin system VapC family toxin [Desulfoscipio gibsoniae]|uniref:Putative nucleic acid-binding protein, contains PIN domain n=1 Tax=Desulfoscipio gibsoniae DSM 7213 TaxID=767817 RepID=R4KBR2_9FIRM|nr:type II toxin-antitoxin system VapC family toxin [Desulfoscipio gibsoniae]AGL00623.1 putative nucleic acid-binding protein, contains PIN domain [Desulfoscipio gibsoniae DSM 7213]
MERYVLDSYAVLAYLNDEPGAQVIQDILQLAQQEQVVVYMSWNNLGEVYYRLQRLYDRQLARKSIEIIKSWPVNFLEIDEQATLLAGDVKARFRLAYADAFAAATAIKNQGILLTGDPEFKQLENEVIKIKWLLPNH